MASMTHETDGTAFRLDSTAQGDLTVPISASLGRSRLMQSSWDKVRVFSAAILLVAAVLKAYDLATGPSFGTGLFENRWFLIAAVEFELLLAIWLLAGNYPKVPWVVALALFSAYTFISVYKVLTGHASCGCFGGVQVNPWYTSVLNCLTVLSLLRWRPKEADRQFVHQLFKRPVGVFLVWIAVGLPAAFAMSNYTDTTISDAGEIIGDGKIVVLRPDTWVGKRFPLLGHIDVGNRLTSGLWLVLLHRHDCSACRKAVSEYEELAQYFAMKSGCPAIAIIECPPFARITSAVPETEWVGGRLSDALEWRLSGPTSVLIEAGQVRNVFTDAGDVELIKAIWGGSGN